MVSITHIGSTQISQGFGYEASSILRSVGTTPKQNTACVFDDDMICEGRTKQSVFFDDEDIVGKRLLAAAVHNLGT